MSTVACRTCLLGCPWNLQRAQWQWCARLEKVEGAGWAFRTLTFISLSSYPCSVPFLHLPQPQTLQIMRFQETRALPLAPTLRSRPLSTSSAHFRAQASSIWLPCAFDSRKTNDKLGPAPRRTKTMQHDMVERCWKWYPKNIRYTGTPWYTPEINMYMTSKCQKSCKISGSKLMFLGFARTSSLISGVYIGMKPSIHFYNSPRAAAPLRSPNFSGLPSANTMILVGPNAPLLHQLPL